MTMPDRLQAAFCLCVLFLWDRTILLGTCLAAQSSESDAFTIQHNSSGNCLVSDTQTTLGLAPCDLTNDSQRWKWGFGHRLYHVGTSLCLGFEVKSKALSLTSCGTKGESVMVWWRCLNRTLFTMYEMGLSIANGKVGVRRDSADIWTADGSQDSICQRPYRTFHTTNGNAMGAPCEFPFLYKGIWHHECLQVQDEPGLTWCSTTNDYDTDKKMGNCLKPEEGCQKLFSGAEGEPCYEFVPDATVTWQEALDSCRSQGADLLSLSGPADLTSPTLMEGLRLMPEKMWIGLHQLDMAQGWQWSDGSGFSYIRWESGMPATSFLVESDCGVLNANQNYETASCDKRLPYVCKKNGNNTTSTASESSPYKDTLCENDWVPWNGFCFRLMKDEPQDFTGAQSHCEKMGVRAEGTLASLHSFDTKEMISTNFHQDDQLDVWIGLVGIGTKPTVFNWVDQAPVTFTYWSPRQPAQPIRDPSCVFYTGKSHTWKVGPCIQKLPFMCQKKGLINETSTELGCPPGEGWRRHGNSCYKVDPKEVSYKDACNITIRSSFEQAFINRLLGEQIGSRTQYFWIGLQEIKATGQYQWQGQDPADSVVKYTNWGWFQPAPGRCVVMSTAKPLGTWETKNCSLFKAGTICRADISAPSTPEPEPDASIPCPSGWTSRPGIKYCYKVFQEERLSRKRSWEEAERFCQALGANLPSFLQQEEMKALHYVMRDTISNDRFFWVGLNRRNPARGSWEWSDGRPVSMAILHQEFHVANTYNRDCTAFKTMRSSLKSLFVLLLHDFPPRPFYATPFHCDAKLEWVCQIPRGKTPNNPEWYNPGGHHETSIFVDGKEYWFVTEPKLTFEEAKLYCSSNSSKLAEPSSFTAARHIHQSLTEISNKTNQRWWADLRKPGHFFPMTLSQMYYYHSNFLGRCTTISPDSLFPETNFSCEQQLSFVCEKHNITSAETNPEEYHPTGLPCGNDALAFRNKCYTVLQPSFNLSFSNANEKCHSLRGSLLSVADQVEQDFVTSLLPKLDVQKMWIGLKLTLVDPEWVDESPVNFVYFNPLLHGLLRPIRVSAMDQESMELCVFIINKPNSPMMGSWDYSVCSERHPVAICQHYADKPEEPSVMLEPIEFHDHTYLLLQQNLSFWEALEECRSRSMDLASVADYLQQSVLTVHVSRAQAPMWIGLFSTDDEQTNYQWTDDSHTVFSRWSAEPTSGPCVFLDTDGFWKGAECEEMLPGAICHKPHAESTSPPEQVTVRCPHQINSAPWIPFRNNCYSIQLVASRWDEFDNGRIHDTCKKLYANASIVTIRDAEENEFVTKQLLHYRSLVQFVWLGLFKDNNDELMKWYDGTNVQFSNWMYGRPDIKGDFMAGINPDGFWELISEKRYFRYFKQKSIVVCKLDNDLKVEYNQSSKDFERYGNLTYQVVTKKLSWFQALEECGQRGGHLASIHDAQHDAHVELITRRDGFSLWIGLSSQDGSGTAFEWSDGTRYDYKATILDNLNGSSSNGKKDGCVFITPNGDWVRADCNILVNGAICYNTTITTPSQRARLQAVSVSNNCPQASGTSKWVEFGDHCYAFDSSFYNYSISSMQEAKSICQDLDAQLLTIMTKEENDFIADYVSENPLVTSRVWLGMDLDSQGAPVAWMDGSALTFSNWGKGDSAGVRGAGVQPLCAVMLSADKGTWARVSCKDSQSRVVCKAAALSGGSPVALGFFIVVVLALLGAIGFIIYKKKKAYFSSSVRYKRNFDEADSTSIITEAD